MLDAMPITRFTIDEYIQEHFVNCKNGELFIELKPTQNKNLIAQIKALNISFPNNYTSEINLSLENWMKNIASSLHTGVVILIDYGYSKMEYYTPERNNGTLTCFHKHKKHDNPLIAIGQQDITAHVNFSQVASSAKNFGLNVIGFCEQAHYLMNLGILDIAKSLYEINPIATANELKLLTMPNQMGSICKVIGLTKNISDKHLTGFSTYNKVDSLFLEPQKL